MPTDLATSLHKCNMKLPGVSMFMASYLKSASFWLAFRSSFSNSYSSLLLIPPVKLSMSLPDRRQIQPFLRQWMLSLTFCYPAPCWKWTWCVIFCYTLSNGLSVSDVIGCSIHNNFLCGRGGWFQNAWLWQQIHHCSWENDICWVCHQRVKGQE